MNSAENSPNKGDENTDFTITSAKSGTHIKISHVPKDYISKFKSVVNQTYNRVEANKLCNDEIKILAYHLNEYFKARFDFKKDINSIHKFDRTQFRNYLASLVLSFCKASRSNSIEAWEAELEEFLSKVNAQKQKYTLPRSSAQIFFDIRRSGDNSINSIDDGDVELAIQVWDVLWKNGFKLFETKIGSDFSSLIPTKSLSWLGEVFSRVESEESSVNIMKASSYDNIYDARDLDEVVEEVYYQLCENLDGFDQIELDQLNSKFYPLLLDYLEFSFTSKYKQYFLRNIETNPQFAELKSPRGHRFRLEVVIEAALTSAYFQSLGFYSYEGDFSSQTPFSDTIKLLKVFEPGSELEGSVANGLTSFIVTYLEILDSEWYSD